MPIRMPYLWMMILSVVFLFSCNVTKKVPEDEYYLQSNKFNFEGKKKFKSELKEYILQKPNNRVFGLIPLQDWSYNQVPAELDSVFLEYYNTNPQERSQGFLDSLYIKYRVQKYVGQTNWLTRQFYNLGSKPVTLDTTKSYASAKNLEKFYFERGYFDAKVSPSFEIDTATQKAQVKYNIQINEPSKIMSFDQSIEDSSLEKLYAETMGESKIKVGQRFDVRDFEEERDRLTKIFKNQGYYKFNELGNELIFKIDSTDDKNLHATMKIAKSQEDSIRKFKKYYYGRIQIFTNNVNDSTFHTTYQGYHLKSNEPFKFKPRVFTDAIAIKEGQLYSRESIENTRKLIFDRENFSLTALELKEPENQLDSTLVTNFYVRPKPKYDLELSFEGMYSEFINFGISPGLNLLTRNVFKSGENLNFNLRGTVGTVNNGTSKQNIFFNAYELSFTTEIKFPRWLLPFNTEKLVDKAYNPKSSLGLGLSGQKNIGLGSRNYLAYLRYEMTPELNSHVFSPFDLEYIRHTEAEKYYRIFTLDNQIKNKTQEAYFSYSPNVENLYKNQGINQNELENLIYSDDVFRKSLPKQGYKLEDYTDFRNMFLRKRNITQDVLIQTISHSYTYNENKTPSKINPWYIYFRGSVSGAYFRLLKNLFKFKNNANYIGEDQFLVGNVPYSEFVRFDLDVRKTIEISPKLHLALRNFMGIALPYGNSTVVPFSRSYFGGGSNDIRAWQAYELSPNPLRPNDRGTYIDNMKITWNAELRFPVTGILNGAVFADAGNIWSVNNESPKTEFHWNTFLKQVAVGAGLGARLDFTFVIARLDFAYKLHDPAYPEGNRWFRDLKILRPQVQFGINYPF